MIRWVVWFLVSSGAAVACETAGQRMSSEIQNAPKVHVALVDSRSGKSLVAFNDCESITGKVRQLAQQVEAGGAAGITV